MASMKSFQALRSPAIPLTSFHDLPPFLISSSIVPSHVLFGLPLLLYPWGCQYNAVFSIAPDSLRNVSYQGPFSSFYLISIGLCLVTLHSSSFVISSVHFYSLFVLSTELLVSNWSPPLLADRGRLTRYGRCWGNKIPRVDQIQHHCFVEKGELQRSGEETQHKISLLRWQSHHWDRVLWANNLCTLNPVWLKKPNKWP
jgi:hypothetical protein